MHFSYFILAWLRLNCMEVFHYVAKRLESVPLFETEVAPLGGNGAIYNDYDNFESMLDHVNESDFSFSQSDKLEAEEETGIPQSEVE